MELLRKEREIVDLLSTLTARVTRSILEIPANRKYKDSRADIFSMQRSSGLDNHFVFCCSVFCVFLFCCEISGQKFLFFYFRLENKLVVLQTKQRAGNRIAFFIRNAFIYTQTEERRGRGDLSQ